MPTDKILVGTASRFEFRDDPVDGDIDDQGGPVLAGIPVKDPFEAAFVKSMIVYFWHGPRGGVRFFSWVRLERL